MTSFDELAVGDEVWCLAAVGTPFLVAGPGGQGVLSRHWHRRAKPGVRGAQPEDCDVVRDPTANARFGQVRMKPVAEASDGIVTVGPNVPLRLGMTWYRWSLSFGEIILNWCDFLPPEGGGS
jgi:hypothetical protein